MDGLRACNRGNKAASHRHALGELRGGVRSRALDLLPFLPRAPQSESDDRVRGIARVRSGVGEPPNAIAPTGRLGGVVVGDRRDEETRLRIARLRPQIPRRHQSNDQTYSSMIHVLERNASLEERWVKKTPLSRP
jgi:hypothetical protein